MNTNQNNEKTNDIKKKFIYFGSYPQTLKSDRVKIDEKSVDKNGYYTGSDGNKYAKVSYLKKPNDIVEFCIFQMMFHLFMAGIIILRWNLLDGKF